MSFRRGASALRARCFEKPRLDDGRAQRHRFSFEPSVITSAPTILIHVSMLFDTCHEVLGHLAIRHEQMRGELGASAIAARHRYDGCRDEANRERSTVKRHHRAVDRPRTSSENRVGDRPQSLLRASCARRLNTMGIARFECVRDAIELREKDACPAFATNPSNDARGCRRVFVCRAKSRSNRRGRFPVEFYREHRTRTAPRWLEEERDKRERAPTAPAPPA